MSMTVYVVTHKDNEYDPEVFTTESRAVHWIDEQYAVEDHGLEDDAFEITETIVDSALDDAELQAADEAEDVV